MKPEDFKYCPRCKSDLKSTEESFECGNCGMKIYKNSAPTASSFIVKGDKVLFCKRGIEPFKGKYDVIGGFLKNQEDPETGVLREGFEETGLTLKIIKFLGVYMDTYGPDGQATLNFYYVTEIVKGEMKAADDAEELIWFPIENTPPLAFANNEEALKDLKKWFRNSGRGGQN